MMTNGDGWACLERRLDASSFRRVAASLHPTRSCDGTGRLLDKYWEWIFREQLNGWMRDPKLWPEELTHEKFLEWFDCELSTMIWDMLKTRIKPAL
jgi:hypothetical protein